MPESALVDLLLAEDGDADAEMIARALARGGIAPKLVRVRDGVEALDFLFRTGAFSGRAGDQPRLVLLDLKMPRLGGIDVLRRLRTAEETRTIPIVILSSSAEERDILDSYRAGANGYLVKPVDSAEFRSMIAQAGAYWLRLNRLPTRGPAGEPR